MLGLLSQSRICGGAIACLALWRWLGCANSPDQRFMPAISISKKEPGTLEDTAGRDRPRFKPSMALARLHPHIGGVTLAHSGRN